MLDLQSIPNKNPLKVEGAKIESYNTLSIVKGESFRRLLPFVVFEALDDKTLKALVDDLFTKSVLSLQKT